MKVVFKSALRGQASCESLALRVDPAHYMLLASVIATRREWRVIAKYVALSRMLQWSVK